MFRLIVKRIVPTFKITSPYCSATSNIYLRSIHQALPGEDEKYPKWIPDKNVSEDNVDFSNHDSEKFGTLTNLPKDINEELDELPDEPGDEEIFDFLDDTGKKTRKQDRFYYTLIQKLLDEKRVADAIDVLETRMLKKERIVPDYYTYNLLINGCGRVGFCEKAFKLYSQMKKKGIKRTNATYTGLFNACAESTYPEEALKRLNNLRKDLNEKSVQLNIINYNAMIKAYGRLKDIESAFLVVDELLTRKFTLLPETFGFILQSCISDKESGLRHALIVWHKMRAKNVTPTLYTYNLLIRCIRDCGFGDEEDLKDAINRITQGAANDLTIDSKTDEICQIEDKTDEKHPIKYSSDENVVEELEVVENRPNLLDKYPKLGTIVSIREVKSPTDKLLLLGGYRNLMNQMSKDDVKPDIKTYTQLLNIMPSSEASEKHILDEMKNNKVSLDIDFCNMLIKQRALRHSYDKGKEVLKIIQQNYLQPDIVTFGVLAMCCRNQYEAEELLHEMGQFSYRMNVEILGAMLNKACLSLNFSYAQYLMELMKRIRIQPSERVIEMLNDLDKKAGEYRRRVKKKDQTVPSFVKKPIFYEQSMMFKEFLNKWKKRVTIYKPPHPYEQFKKPSENVSHDINTTDITKFKGKQPWSFKTKRFRVRPEEIQQKVKHIAISNYKNRQMQLAGGKRNDETQRLESVDRKDHWVSKVNNFGGKILFNDQTKRYATKRYQKKTPKQYQYVEPTREGDGVSTKTHKEKISPTLGKMGKISWKKTHNE